MGASIVFIRLQGSINVLRIQHPDVKSGKPGAGMNPMTENLALQIPHRSPMHWLDGAQAGPNSSILAHRTISPDHPFVINGRLARAALIELMAQAAACSALPLLQDRQSRPEYGMLVALRDLRFLDSPKVGERLQIAVRMTRNLGNMFLCEIAANIGARQIAAGRFTFALA
jgi:predicted hotdog family 3-hydroxylacyl-ACP dehydratase